MNLVRLLLRVPGGVVIRAVVVLVEAPVEVLAGDADVRLVEHRLPGTVLLTLSVPGDLQTGQYELEAGVLGELVLGEHLVSGHDMVHHLPDDCCSCLLVILVSRSVVFPEERVGLDVHSADILLVLLTSCLSTSGLGGGLFLCLHHVSPGLLLLHNNVFPPAVNVG